MTKMIEDAIELFESISGAGDYIAAGRTLAAAYRANEKDVKTLRSSTHKIIQSCQDSRVGDENEGDYGERIEEISTIAHAALSASTATEGADDAN